MTRDQIGFLTVGMAGSLLGGVAGQFASVSIADLQGALASTPDDASWLLTAYTMASLVAVVTSGVIVRTLGIGRFMVANAVVFAATALACAMGPALGVMIGLRALQGFAAGGFGPAAFVAAFTVAGPGGPRLPLVVTVLAFMLLLPGALGPVVAGFVEDGFGWRALFLAQAVIGATLALAASLYAPHKAIDWSGLKTDWTAVILLSLAAAMLILVLSQGTRRFWFDSAMIVWCTATGVGATAGLAFLMRFSPVKIIAPGLVLTRKFGISVTLNFVFRAGLVVTAWLVPQFLIVVQGYRPLETARLFLWAAIPQLFAVPLAWRLMHWTDTRIVMGLGLLLCAGAAALAATPSALDAADQLRPTLVMLSVGQVLFLSAALVVGSLGLRLADLPSASVFFNLTTLGGTTAGVGLVSHFAAEREKFHSHAITSNLSLYDAFDADRVARLADALAARVAEDTLAAARATSVLAEVARREAWILSFADAFIVVAGVLLLGALGVVAIGRSPPLRPSPNVAKDGA